METAVVCKGLRQVLEASFPHYCMPSSCSGVKGETEQARRRARDRKRWEDEELLEQKFSHLGSAFKRLGDDMPFFLSCNSSPAHQEKSPWMHDPHYSYDSKSCKSI